MRKLALFAMIILGLLSCQEGNKTKNSSSDTKKEPAMTDTKTILFFGNSLTAGYGLEDPTEAFPAQIQDKIDSLNLPYKVINGGLSGETTAGGKSRIEWLLKQKIDVFVLELGANDGLRGLPVSESKKNLQDIIDQVKAKYPQAKQVLLGMEVPPNMGKAYAADFREMYRDLARKNDMVFVPFMLAGVAGNPSLNLQDGIHPTGEGYKIVAENVWKILKPELMP